jgi:hypothetical protein
MIFGTPMGRMLTGVFFCGTVDLWNCGIVDFFSLTALTRPGQYYIEYF